MNKKLIIFSGVPCSGKSTYGNYLLGNKNTILLSRDILREKYFGDHYKYTKSNEKFISQKFDEIMDSCIENNLIKNVILDNTHCKEKYLDNLIMIYGKVFDIQIIFFEVNIYKAHFRNVMRFIKTGKWIPCSVLNTMYKNFNKINKNKYKNLLD